MQTRSPRKHGCGMIRFPETLNKLLPKRKKKGQKLCGKKLADLAMVDVYVMRSFHDLYGTADDE